MATKFTGKKKISKIQGRVKASGSQGKAKPSGPFKARLGDFGRNRIVLSEAAQKVKSDHVAGRENIIGSFRETHDFENTYKIMERLNGKFAQDLTRNERYSPENNRSRDFRDLYDKVAKIIDGDRDYPSPAQRTQAINTYLDLVDQHSFIAFGVRKSARKQGIAEKCVFSVIKMFEGSGLVKKVKKIYKKYMVAGEMLVVKTKDDLPKKLLRYGMPKSLDFAVETTDGREYPVACKYINKPPNGDGGTQVDEYDDVDKTIRNFIDNTDTNLKLVVIFDGPYVHDVGKKTGLSRLETLRRRYRNHKNIIICDIDTVKQDFFGAERLI